MDQNKGLLRVVLLASVAFAVPAAAQDVVASASQQAEQFVKKSVAEQKKLAQAVRDTTAAIGGEAFDAVRALVTAAEARRAAADKAHKPGKTKRPNKRAPANEHSDWQLPATVAYVYGQRVLRSLAGTAAQKQQLAERRTAIELTLLGMLPDTDLALSELERELDGDRGADAFAAFLAMWRNGDESFYEALDRTAGTKDSVFFYDVMLGDFVAAFVKGRDAAAKEVKKGLNRSHDALHDAFLSYRQYRAFREALSLALLLPPDVPLPKRLRRYEDRGAGSYSLREQVTMVLALHEYDPMAVAKLVNEHAQPLPDPLWSHQHDPYPMWSNLFADAMPAMISAANSTDAFLQAAVAKRLADAQKLRKCAAMVGVGPS